MGIKPFTTIKMEVDLTSYIRENHLDQMIDLPGYPAVTLEVSTDSKTYSGSWPEVRTAMQSDGWHISQPVVTYQSPSGNHRDICPSCQKELVDTGTWPRDDQGGEYCQVSQGLHPGVCWYCDDGNPLPEVRLTSKKSK